MAAKKDYFGLEYIVSLILAIIPFTSWVCSFVTRFMEGKIVAGLLRVLIPPVAFVCWILDIVYMVTKKQIFRFLDI